MSEAPRPQESVYGEHLKSAKEHLRKIIMQILPQIVNQRDKAQLYSKLLQYFDQLSIVVDMAFKDPLGEGGKPVLKFGLDDNVKEGLRGFALPLTEDAATKIRTEMDPSLYAALCEEGLARQIAIYECIDHTDVYEQDLLKLHLVLYFVQTAQNPFEIAEKIEILPAN